MQHIKKNVASVSVTNVLVFVSFLWPAKPLDGVPLSLSHAVSCHVCRYQRCSKNEPFSMPYTFAGAYANLLVSLLQT